MSLVNYNPLALSASIARTADTSAYAAGDAIGIDAAGSPGSALINFGIVVTQRLKIEDVRLRIDRATVPSGMGAFRLHLYVGAPAALLDNAAWDLVAADRDKYLGYAELPTPAVAGASTLWTQALGVDMRNWIAASGDLYGILQTVAGYTPGSGEVYKPMIAGADC
jgi:hypothetical protein